MIQAPPGSAKSTYVTTLFSPWMMAHRPGFSLIGSSHTSDLATDFSGKIQDIVLENRETLGYTLRTEAKSRWETTNGGIYLAAGVNVSIPGFRAGGAIIDDPIKGRASADSEADRKRVWDWFNGDLERRLIPGAFIVLMHTRWHEDDLAGRLLLTEPDRWTVLKIPAEAEEDDPLGRRPGEWLWEDDAYGYGASLRDIKESLEARGATREWFSQYQQSPRPAEGALFKTSNIQVVEVAPAGGKIVRGWDLASSKQIGTLNPDWTVGVKLAAYQNGTYCILDVVRLRDGPDVINATIRNTAVSDGIETTTDIPKDPGQASATQVQLLTRLLAGYPVVSSAERGDKATRAAPVASQVNAGNFSMVRAPWNAALIDELSSFPAGAKDDQVDALSRAFSNVVNGTYIPDDISPLSSVREAPRII